jgi:hypothetical protein
LGQDDRQIQTSVLLRPELYLDLNDGQDVLAAIPILRLDAVDGNRTHGDFRELYWRHIGDGWSFTAGIDTVFWGAAEARHLVDIVNQTDLVEDPDGEDKLGQPMMSIAYEFEAGGVELYWLPVFRERLFPGRNGRFRAAPVVRNSFSDTPDEKDTENFAVRYTNTFGAWDVGLYHFHGVGREPRLQLRTSRTGESFIAPVYDQIEQTGFDLQGAVGDWLWKLEGLGRKGQGDKFAAFVGGFEYTYYGIVGSDTDFGIIAEYLRDGRGADTPPTPFDDDVFVGLRLSLNDVSDTSFLGGMMVDLDNGGLAARFEYSTRLTDFVRLEIEGHMSQGISSSDPLSAFEQDHNLLLRISRYF